MTPRRRLMTLVAVGPVAFIAFLAALLLMHDAPFLQAVRWATGIWFLAMAVVLPAVTLFALDISGRRHAERALLAREERLRQVIRLSHIGIFDHDHVTGEVYWSPEHREIFGWSADEQFTFADITARIKLDIHPDDRDRVAAALKQAHERETGPFDIEYRFIRNDGSVRWVMNRSQTFFAGEGAARHAVRTVGAVQDITERKHSERQLKLTQASIDKSNVAIFWVSPLGQITYGNECACHSLGLSLQEILIRKVWDFDPDFTPETWAESWQELKRAKVLHIRSRHRRKDGTIFPVEATPTFVVFEGEEHAFVFTQDVTERERAERELKLMLAAIDSSRTPFYAIDPHNRIVYANEHAWLGLGLTREELIGAYVWDIDPDVTPQTQAESWKILREAGEVRFETRHRRKDGTLIPIELTSNLFTYKDEEYALVFAQDITERKSAEQALRTSEERLRQVALVHDIGVYDYDHLADTHYWSAEQRKHLGLRADESASPERLMAAIHPDDRERMQDAIQRSFDPSADGHFDVQHRIVTRDGSIRWMESRAQTFFAGEGSSRHAVRTVGAMVDITEHVKAEQTLRESVREKETLLREVHHRVKNNLQIIASLLHFQAKKIKDPDDLAAFLEGRDRLRSMILVHEKLYQSRGLTRIQFGNYLKGLAGELQRSHGSRSGRQIDVRITAEDIALPIESALPCGMIVCELLTNVFKYAFPGERSGSAHIQLAAEDDHVRLTVSDDGVGLPRDFDPHQSPTFGWQLIRNLANQLGAAVSVAREGGTRVSIAFPSTSQAPA